jgi:hypothetical protein
MKNVKIPISISSYYEGSAEGDSAQPVTSLTPIYRNIRITNLTATSPRGAGLGLIVDRLTDVIYYLSAYHAYLEPRSASAGLIAGLPECEVSDVVLENARIWAPEGLTIRNAKAIKLNNVKIETQQGRPFILENAVVEGLEQTNR